MKYNIWWGLEMKQIHLTKNKIAIVDDEDFDYLSKWKWCYTNKGYAFRSQKRSETGSKKRKGVYLHRQLMGNPSQQVDHINGDTLDNRKANLRLANHSENMRNRKLQKNNTSGFKGVWFNKKRQKFIATIKINGQSRTIKSANTAEEAAKAYDIKAKELYGSFARLNFNDQV